MTAVVVPILGSIPTSYLVRAIAALVLVPLLLAMRDKADRSTGVSGAAGAALPGFALLGFGAVAALVLRTVILHPPEWDFYAFWVRMKAIWRPSGDQDGSPSSIFLPRVTWRTLVPSAFIT